MDPLSVAASVIAVLGLGLSLTKVVREHCAAYKDAPKVITGLIQILDTLHDVMKELSDFLLEQEKEEKGFPSGADTLLCRAMSECIQKLDSLKTRLEKTTTGAVLMKAISRMKWPLDEAENRKTMEDLSRYVSLFQFALTLSGRQVLAETSDNVNRALELLEDLSHDQSLTSYNISEVLKVVSSLQENNWKIEELAKGIKNLEAYNQAHDQTTKRKEILDSISSLSFRRKHQDVFKERQVGTGEWFLQSADFQEWLKGNEDGTLWCPGDPGAGKTVMTSIAIEHVISTFAEQNIGVAYIYCQYKDMEKQTVLKLLSSLTRQLAEQCHPLPEAIQDFYNRTIETGSLPTLDDSLALLRSAAEYLGKSYVFIDALDELNEETREDFLQVLADLQSDVHLFITSRPHVKVDDYLDGARRLDISATDDDLKTYILGAIARRRRLTTFITREPTLQQDILSSVIEKARCIFLVARLQTDILGSQTTPKKVREALKTMPSGLHDAYSDAIKRIKAQGSDDAELAMRILSWIFCAKRSLRVEELRYALAVEPGDVELDKSAVTEVEIMLSVCGGLVSVEPESQLVRLVHFTLQEYLAGQSKQLFPAVELEVSKTCLTYLNFDEFRTGACSSDASLIGRLEKYRFAEYASRHWGHHVRGDREAILEDLAIDHLADPSGLASWAQIAHVPAFRFKGSYDAYPKSVTALHAAAYWGLEHLAIELLEQADDLNARDSTGKTALHWAAKTGSESLLKVYLRKFSDIEARDNTGQTALHLAAQDGHTKAVALLSRHGADVNTANDEGNTALHLAARNGHEAVARLLLEDGADIDAQNNKELTPIRMAAMDGHDGLIRLFVDKGAYLGPVGQTGETVLHVLAFLGQEESTRTLLKSGRADIHARTATGRTVLYEASKWAKSGLVKLLLEYGADINVGFDGSVHEVNLQSAVTRDNTDTINALLDAGADINQLDDLGRTPVFEAAKLKRVASMRLLLDRGADPNVKAYLDAPRDGERGRAPLHVAAMWLEAPDVEYLLLKGALPDAQDEDGRTPLHEAASRGHRAIVETLLEHGAAINATDFGGRTVLQSAAAELVPLLGRLGAVRGTGEFTVVEAAKFGVEEAMERLLAAGADPNVRAFRARTALHEAAACPYRRAKNIKMLVNAGADPNLKDSVRGQTPLHLACWMDDIEAVQTLLDHGANVNAETTDVERARTPLIEACRNARNPATIKLLLDRGAYPNAKDHTWHAEESALAAAAAAHRIEFVKLLVDYGADVEQPDNNGNTPLQRSLQHSDIYRVLLQAKADEWSVEQAMATARSRAARFEHHYDPAQG